MQSCIQKFFNLLASLNEFSVLRIKNGPVLNGEGYIAPGQDFALLFMLIVVAKKMQCNGSVNIVPRNWRSTQFLSFLARSIKYLFNLLRGHAPRFYVCIELNKYMHQATPTNYKCAYF